MMTMMTMINFLSGIKLSSMKTIKNAGSKSKNKRRLTGYCLASIKMMGWCVPEDEKKETEKLWA